MLKRLATALLGIVIVFISCQKEVSEELPVVPQPPDPPATIKDSTLLTQFVGFYTTGNMDTFVKATIAYDALKRISMISMIFPDDPGDFDEEKFFYNGNDTLPYKMTKFWDGDVHDTLFLTYENGKIIKDSLVVWELYLGNHSLSYVETFTFEQLGSNRYFVRRNVYGESDLLNPVSGDSTYCIRNIQDGNVISGKDSVYDYGSQTLIEYTYQKSFDDKKNPLRRLTLPYSVITQDLLDGHALLDLDGKNNVNSSTMTVKVGSNAIETFPSTFSYEYRSDGYPISMTNNAALPGPSKLLFYYSK